MEIGNDLTLELGKYQNLVEKRIAKLQQQNFSYRLWHEKESIWSKSKYKVSSSHLPMGWLNCVDKMLVNLPEVLEFCDDIKRSELKFAVLLGMGGSSMAPIVFREIFGEQEEGVKLHVLDSTDPETIRNIESRIDICKTLFIVSSKSGSTAEVTALYTYFYEHLTEKKGERAGENFVAITDEGSPLISLAKRKKFRKTFLNFSDIGGRYSALSYFGIVPAALMGLNVSEILTRALTMVNHCGPTIQVAKNPGLCLGSAIAEMSLRGTDKLIYVLPERFMSFGLWLEQLLAESTGKSGKGILPLAYNPNADNNTYGKDCFFVQVDVAGDNDMQSNRQKEYRANRFPTIGILLKDKYDIGKEFFRWEVATATAGAILSVNPFDQPNVQSTKKCTDQFLEQLKLNGNTGRRPSVKDGQLVCYSENKATSCSELIRNMLNTTKPGDYITVQAFLPDTSEIKKTIKETCTLIQNTFGISVMAEVGPRYLHSTGQYHKGGPAKGIFIQLIYETENDIAIPQQKYSFGQLIRAQAMGDMEALKMQKRRVVLIDLGKDASGGLSELQRIIRSLGAGHKPGPQENSMSEHEASVSTIGKAMS